MTFGEFLEDWIGILIAIALFLMFASWIFLEYNEQQDYEKFIPCLELIAREHCESNDLSFDYVRNYMAMNGRDGFVCRDNVLRDRNFIPFLEDELKGCGVIE